MVDTDKMKALASETRHMADVAVELGWNGCAEQFTECADAIDTLLAALDQNRIDQLEAQGAYEELDRENNRLRAALEASDKKRKEAILDAEKARDERNRAHIKLNAEWIEKTAELRAALEAASADKLDADRYRWIKPLSRHEMYNRGVELSWYAPTENLDADIDAARARGES